MNSGPDALTVPDSSRTWSQDTATVLKAFSVDPAVGLDAAQVLSRRSKYGRNQLSAVKRRQVLPILADQFKSVVIMLLLTAGVFAIVFADHVEGLAIFIVIAINASIGFVTELKAVRSMESLNRLGRVETVVMREGLLQQIPAEDLVPGDIVIREGGDIVTADIRLIEAAKLQADESTLTGESMPVRKSSDTIAADVPFMEQSNMLFKGTAITRGSSKGVVVRTGLNTELGRISELVTTAEAQHTPLEKRLNSLAQRLVWAVLVLAVVIAVVGIATGREVFLAIEVAIALAVAAIPEGLPIVATIALARGMWRMAGKNALIARLSAVETLGATSVILTDKTGTLTENRMTVTAVKIADTDISISDNGHGASASILENGNEPSSVSAALLDDLLSVASLCNNASVNSDGDSVSHTVGDPTEVALLHAAESRNIHRRVLLKRYPEIKEIAFDPNTKLMATMHTAENGTTLVAVKGAPETVLPICTTIQTFGGAVPLLDSDHAAWLARADELGDHGLRTLAIARKAQRNVDTEAYSDLTLIGVLGLEDPPRDGVRDAIDRCHSAGITVIMLTGDHAATARNIAIAVDIVEPDAESRQFVSGAELESGLDVTYPDRLEHARVFSRVTPEQKLNLIDSYQRHDQVVAMTGDGVNDAPALKKADIGVAMGIRGTAVAKEAAAMVLQDDDFGTIVEAVAQGRAIYENIRKFVVYLLSCNISEVLVVSIATIAGAPLPLLPLQILFLNLVTDVFPALALGVGEGSPELMKERPRPFAEPILTRTHWIRIGLHGIVIAVTVLSAMAIAVFQLGAGTEKAVTISFCTLALAQVWHVFNMRNNLRKPFNNEITRNVWIWLAITVCVLLLLAAVYVPTLSNVLKISDPGLDGWLLITGMSVVPIIVTPIVRGIANVFR